MITLRRYNSIKIIAIILVLLPIVIALSSQQSHAGTVIKGTLPDGPEYELDSDGLLTITGEGAVTGDGLPGEKHENPWNGTAYRDKVKEVYIGEGIWLIGDDAFYSCKSLEKVTLPGSLRNISYRAFQNCTALKDVNLPEGLTEIGRDAFYNCKSLENVVLPSTLKTVAMNAFDRCGITELTIPDNMIIKDMAFRYNNIKTLNLPEHPGKIGRQAFAYNTMENLEIPEGTVVIAQEEFAGCPNLETVVMADSVEAIEASAFAGCSSLQDIRMSSSLKSIGSRAFFSCSELRKLTIPKSCEMLGSEIIFASWKMEYIVFRCDREPKFSGAPFGDYAGIIYYDEDAWPVNPTSSISSIMLTDLARSCSQARWLPGRHVVFDAAEWTEVDEENDRSDTYLNDVAVAELVAMIKNMDPESITVYARPECAAMQLEQSEIIYPAQVVLAALDSNASLKVDTLAGSVDLDRESLEGLNLNEDDNVILTITNNGEVGSAEIDCSIHMEVLRDYVPRSVKKVDGEAEIGVPAIGFDDGSVFKGLYDEDGQMRDVEAVVSDECAYFKTSYLSTMSASGDSFKNARVHVSNCVYSGYYKKPSVTVKIGTHTLSSREYKVLKYTNNKSVGTATVYVQGAGKYAGQGTRTGSFYINPKKAVISSISVRSRSMTVNMKTKVSSTGGSKYRIQYKRQGDCSPDAWKTINTTSKSKKITGLHKGSRYYVKVTAYKGSRFGAVSTTKLSNKIK